MSGIEVIALSRLHHTSPDFLKMSEMCKTENHSLEQSSETGGRQNISLKNEEESQIRQKSSYSIDDILRKRQTDDATVQTQVNSFAVVKVELLLLLLLFKLSCYVVAFVKYLSATRLYLPYILEMLIQSALAIHRLPIHI